jgi:hypothetical protein
MYKLIKNIDDSSASVFRQIDNTSFPFAPANTDYANFKREINADEAQLEDADGNVMSADAAKAYVATLP